MPSFVRRDRGLKSVLVQPDGRLLVSGGFAVAGDTPRTYVARLLPDGRADRSFDPHPVAAPANGGAGVAVHAHGGVLLWGNFGTSDNPEPAQQIVRLLADGTPDRTFQVDPSLTFHDLDELVTTLDGAVMVGGQFSVPARQFQRTWVRLAPNGRLEHLFDPATGPWFTPQPDGRVIQWGPASLTNDLWYYHLSRALPNGEPDGSFTAALQDHLATGTEITTVAPLKDGRLAVGLVETNGHGEVVRLLADGQVDSTFHTSLTGQVDRIAELLDGELAVWGVNVPYPQPLTRLRADGSVDVLFTGDAAVDDPRSLNSVTMELDGRLLLCGDGSGGAGPLWRVDGHGRVDKAFDPILGQPGPIQTILALPDGSWLAGGRFRVVDGLDAPYLVQVRPDGQVRHLVAPEPIHDGSGVISLTRHADGTLYAGVMDTNYHGRVLRYTAEGEPDASFRMDAGWGISPTALAVLASGGVVVGFGVPEHMTHPLLWRFHPDGSRDLSFNPVFNADRHSQFVSGLAIASRDRILVSGGFTTVNSSPQAGLVRLEPDGSVDSSFRPRLSWSGLVRMTAIAVGSSGQLVLAGAFTNVDGQARQGLARVDDAGRADERFAPRFDSLSWVYQARIALEPDGSLVVAGDFGRVNDLPCRGLARFEADGSLDPTFDWGDGLDGRVTCLAVDRDEGILLGGAFVHWREHQRSGMLRLASRPKIIDWTEAPHGPFRFTIAAPSGSTVRLESSADLATWTEVGKVTATADALTLFEASVGSYPRLFFRAASW
jgi:uncharacterized delta-60 repeat protein